MMVKVFDIDDEADGAETFRCECDLLDCFPDGDQEYVKAYNELRGVGRYWAGGGAAPLVLIRRVAP